MLSEKFLEKALTGILSDTIEEQGEGFFAALRNSGLCSEEDVRELEKEWRSLLLTRRQESAGAAESLNNLIQKVSNQTPDNETENNQERGGS